MGLKLFISYSRRDLPFVRDLAHSLGQAGIESCLDLTSLSGGDKWNTRIETALKECSHCLVVVSPYSMKSVAVQREVDSAITHQKPIIPLLLQTTKLPEQLQSLQWVDFRISYARAQYSLLAHLRGEPLNADSDVLQAPPRPIKFLGFVPMLYIACPKVVKTVSGLIFLGGFLKFSFGYFNSLPHFALDDKLVLAGLEIMMAVFAMWWTFRAANRHSTLVEMAAVGGLLILFPWFGLACDPTVLWPLLIIPVDLTALIIILGSRSYRRWMTTYSVGWGRDVDR